MLRRIIKQLEKKLDGRAESDVPADASSAVGTNTNLSRREEKAPAREDNESSVAPGTFRSVVASDILLTRYRSQQLRRIRSTTMKQSQRLKNWPLS